LLEVSRAYWQAHSAALVESAAQEAVAAADVSLERVRNREEAGLATALDRLRSEADLAVARQNYTNAAADRASSDRHLRTLSGLDGGTELDAEPRDPGEFEVEAALAARTDLQALRSTEACQRLSRTSAVMQYAPRLSGFAQEQVTNATGFIGQAASWQAGVQLRWNLFDGLGRESAIAEAAAAEREAHARLEDAQARARDELIDAVARYEASGASLRAAEARLAAANEAYRIANDLVEVGRATRVEVSLASRDAYDARVALARARADRAIAAETVRFAAGAPMVGEGG
jgi:outer membrane protein TolC